MKRFLSIVLTALMLISIMSVSFTSTGIVASAADRLPFSSTANMTKYLSGFANESKTYYKMSDGTKTSPNGLKYSGNVPYITQGATCIGKDIYFSATYKSSLNYDFGYIVKLDASDNKYYVSERLPISHANDLCYNPDKNWILISNNTPDGTALTIINPDDLTLIKQMKLTHIYGDTNTGFYGIEYNTRTKEYIICSSGTDTMNYILDEDFQVLRSHQREDPNLDKSKSPYYLKQGMYATPDYVLHVYAGAPIGSYVNMIIVTDWDGNKIQTIKDTIKYEIEDVFADEDGYIYFIYHQDSGGGYIYQAKMTAWTIKYLPNGGEGTMPDSEHYYGTAKATSANTFTREGYTFAGWKLSRKSDGKHAYTNDNMTTNSWYIPGTQPAGWRKSVYENKRSVSALAHDLFDEVYFEAQWTPKATGTQSFYIEFDPNGGTGTMDTLACIWGGENHLPENTITREDYKFLGWSARRRSTDKWRYINKSTGADYWSTWTTSSSYKLALYQPGSTVSKTSNEDRDIVEFMCQWEYIPNSVFVFDANDGSGEMENQKLVHGTPSELTSNKFTKSGYTFAGWIAQKESDGTYYLEDGTWATEGTPYVFADGETVNDIGEGTGDKIKMIAQWDENPEYTITFDANGGDGEMADIIATTNSAINLPTNEFTKEGYTFAGWKTADGTEYANEATVTNVAQAGETATLTAQWTANTYTVKFASNGGSGEMEYMSMTYDVAKNLTANTFKKTGYTFAGWTFDGKTYADEAEVKNLATSGVVTLTAEWTANTYTVKFDANGGTGDMADMAMTYDVAKNLTANTFMKTGYTFAGWTLNGETYADKAEVKNLATSGTVTLTAKWTPITYTIKFVANGGTGEMATMTVKYGETVNLEANTFTKTICKFKNWTAADGTIYEDTAEISNLTATDDEEIVLTAQWLMYGDVDGNEKVNIRDVSYIQMHLANDMEFTDEQIEKANVNGDSKFNIRDVSFIQMYLAKEVSDFPVCQN